MIRRAVVGSRDYPDCQAIEDLVDSFPDDTLFVSGGSGNVDLWAQWQAARRKLPSRIFPYQEHLGKGGGPARNTELVNFLAEDEGSELHAFWYEPNGRPSKGTRDVTAKASSHGVQVFNYRYIEGVGTVREESPPPVNQMTLW